MFLFQKEFVEGESRRWGEGREWKKGGHMENPFCKFRWVTVSSKWKRKAWVDLCTLGFTFDISLLPRHLNQKQEYCIWIFSSLSLCSISSIRFTFFFHYGAVHFFPFYWKIGPFSEFLTTDNFVLERCVVNCSEASGHIINYLYSEISRAMWWKVLHQVGIDVSLVGQGVGACNLVQFVT